MAVEKTKFSFALPVKMRKKLDTLATKADRSTSSFIMRILDKHVKKLMKGGK